jgi:hypothetical protein
MENHYGKSPCLRGKSTISMAIFNSYFDITRGYSMVQTGITVMPISHVQELAKVVFFITGWGKKQEKRCVFFMGFCG